MGNDGKDAVDLFKALSIQVAGFMVLLSSMFAW